MGIQTWIKKIRQKIEFKKAVETGKIQEATGTISVPTTSGTISVPTTSITAQTYLSSPAGRTTSYGGGGGGSSGGTQAPSTSTMTERTPTGNVQEELRKQTQKVNLTNEQLRNLNIQNKISGGQREVYNPKTKTYMTSAYGMGAGGTAYQRPPTPSEQIKIDLATARGEPSTYLTGYSPKQYNEIVNLQNVISTSSETLNKNVETFENKYKDLIEGNQFVGTTANTEIFNKKYKDLIKGNEFIGTKAEYDIYTRQYNALIKQQEAEFKKYQSDYNELNREQIKVEGNIARYKNLGGSLSDKGLEMPTVNIGGGFGLRGREVPLSKFAGLYSATGMGAVDVTRKIAGAFDVGVTQMAYAGGEVVGKAIGEEKKFTIFKKREMPEETLKNIFIPQFGTQQIDITTGKPITGYKDITIPAHIRPEVSFTGKEYGLAVGDVAAFGGTMAKYAIPTAGSIFWGAEVGASVQESGSVGQWIKDKPLEAGLTATFILGAGISKGVKVVKSIQVEKMAEQLLRLSEKPIRYMQVVDKGQRQVLLRGFQTTEKLERQINVMGALRKTEKGFEFVPYGKGYATTTGEIKRIIGTKNIFKVDTFVTGAKGGSIPYKNIGDIQWLKTISTSGYEPVASSYALFKEGTKISDIQSQLQKNILLGGTTTKKITLGGNLFKLRENVYLGSQKDKELGLILIKRAKEEGRMFGISPAKITKTPLSKTFAEIPQTKLFDVPVIKKGLAGQTIITKPTVTEIPLMVGGLGLKTIPSETGQYKTTTGLSLVNRKEIIQPSIIKTEQFLNLGVGVREISFVGEKERQGQVQKVGQVSAFKEAQLEVQKSFLDVLPAQVSIQAQIQRQSQLQKQALRQTQLQKQIQRQALQQAQAQISPIKPTSFKTKIPFGLGDALKKVQKMAEGKPEIFEAWGKVFGKEKKIGTFGTQESAEKGLSKYLKKELSASGFLTKDKKKIKASELKLLKDIEFRKSKLSEFLIIERKEKRLRKSGTGKIIQAFRKTPRKGSKKRSLFGI